MKGKKLSIDLFEKGFAKKGYVKLSNVLPDYSIFKRMHKEIQVILDFLAVDCNLIAKLNATEKEFHKDIHKRDFFNGVQQRFVNGEFVKCNKKNKAEYAQFSLDYINFLEKEHPDLYQAYPQLKELMTDLKIVHFITEKIFHEMIKSLDEKYPGVENRIFCDPKAPTPIMLRIVQYSGNIESDDKYIIDPHYDDSALSIIVCIQDTVNQHLVLAPNQSKCQSDLKALRMKKHYNSQKGTTSAIVIPGAYLNAIGIDIDPTLHAVESMPVNTVRYALVAYLMVPFICRNNDKLVFENLQKESLKSIVSAQSFEMLLN
jgi:hypothetical protein